MNLYSESESSLDAQVGLGRIVIVAANFGCVTSFRGDRRKIEANWEVNIAIVCLGSLIQRMIGITESDRSPFDENMNTLDSDWLWDSSLHIEGEGITTTEWIWGVWRGISIESPYISTWIALRPLDLITVQGIGKCWGFKQWDGESWLTEDKLCRSLSNVNSKL